MQLNASIKFKTCRCIILFFWKAGKCNFNVEDDTSITNVSFSETVIVFNHAMDITYSFEPTKDSWIKLLAKFIPWNGKKHKRGIKSYRVKNNSFAPELEQLLTRNRSQLYPISRRNVRY